MDTQTKEIYSEVYSILHMLGEEYINKLPASLYTMIKEEKLESYNPTYDKKISIDKQHVKRDTLALLALIHISYWCNSEEEKQELNSLFNNNEEKHQEEIREKYNPDNIFKARIEKMQQSVRKQEETAHDTSIVEYKENIFTKIINKIKNIFHIKKKF